MILKNTKNKLKYNVSTSTCILLLEPCISITEPHVLSILATRVHTTEQCPVVYQDRRADREYVAGCVERHWDRITVGLGNRSVLQHQPKRATPRGLVPVGW